MPFSQALTWMDNINPDFPTALSLPRPGISPLDGEQGCLWGSTGNWEEEGGARRCLLSQDFGLIFHVPIPGAHSAELSVMFFGILKDKMCFFKWKKSPKSEGFSADRCPSGSGDICQHCSGRGVQGTEADLFIK